MRRVILILCLLLLLAGCRRRITPMSENVILQGTEPTVETTTEPPETTTEEETEETEESTTEPTEEPAELPTETVVVTEAVVTVPATSATERIETTEPTEPTEETEPVLLTVTLDPNRGTCEVETLQRAQGEPYGELPTATRSGFSFTGWYRSPNGGERITAEQTVTADVTLYAHWAAKGSILLRFDANGGRVNETERSVTEGEPVGELPVPRREGYEFEDWFANGEAVTAQSVFTADVTLVAQWRYEPYAYWSFRLANIRERMYSCQQISAYIETEPHLTAQYSPLLSDISCQNVAQNREDPHVDDDWVRSKNPDVIIGVGGSYADLAARFPDYRVLTVPSAALYGTEAQRLYLRLALGQRLYPDWFDVDLAQAAAELGVSGEIIG